MHHKPGGVGVGDQGGGLAEGAVGAPMEVPGVLAADIREFFGKLT